MHMVAIRSYGIKLEPKPFSYLKTCFLEKGNSFIIEQQVLSVFDAKDHVIPYLVNAMACVLQFHDKCLAAMLKCSFTQPLQAAGYID